MKIINNNKLDLSVLKNCLAKPELFQKSNARFWDDEHISGEMLKYHLNPEVEAASKTKETIEAETKFIIELTKMDDTKAVLDLGCGPGLYVREFAKTGAVVTGVDLSGRSIAYANENIKPGRHNINFINMNYLELDFQDSFDIATLIFYDFCPLNTSEQKELLSKIHRALKDDGLFIFDVISDNWKTGLSSNIAVYEEGGFWSPDPYIEILNTFLYEDPKTEGVQYTIIDEHGTTKVIRIYHRLFGLEEITQLLNEHHFTVEKVYRNLKGEPLSGDSETYGIIARKA